MTFPLVADEHVKRVFITELEANGFDVARVGVEYEQGTSDVDHLKRAREEGRVVLSNDSDFARLHGECDHAGIILYHDQNVSVSEFIQGIKRIERFVSAPELRGRIVWLDQWIG